LWLVTSMLDHAGGELGEGVHGRADHARAG
jgi:hypothetical protein